MSPKPTPLHPYPAVPRGLTTEGRRLWYDVHRDWELDAASERILLVAIEALARLREAQAAVRAHGLLVAGVRGGLKANPALAVENQARVAFLSAMRQLDFDATETTLSPHARAAANAFPRWRKEG
ncbi:MAG: P27 family phage terminase small subunit [Chloroflexota bacterium]